jgi:hypothetical protein
MARGRLLDQQKAELERFAEADVIELPRPGLRARERCGDNRSHSLGPGWVSVVFLVICIAVSW